MEKRKIRRVRDFIFIPLDYEKDNRYLNDQEIELKSRYGGFHPLAEYLEDYSASLNEDINLEEDLLYGK